MMQLITRAIGIFCVGGWWWLVARAAFPLMKVEFRMRLKCNAILHPVPLDEFYYYLVHVIDKDELCTE